VGVRTDDKVEFAADHVEKFHSGVLVQPLLAGGSGLKLSRERVEFALVGCKIQTLEPVGNLRSRPPKPSRVRK
jgi:hypothetical protein